MWSEYVAILYVVVGFVFFSISFYSIARRSRVEREERWSLVFLDLFMAGTIAMYWPIVLVCLLLVYKYGEYPEDTTHANM